MRLTIQPDDRVRLDRGEYIVVMSNAGAVRARGIVTRADGMTITVSYSWWRRAWYWVKRVALWRIW